MAQITPSWRVLVAEDSQRIAQRIVTILADTGGLDVVGPVADGDAAIVLFMSAGADAIVLDLSMPFKSGLEVLREIRASEGTTQRSCLIILLTNHVERSIRDECMAAGADFFLNKSAQFDQIAKIILDNRQQNCVNTAVRKIPTPVSIYDDFEYDNVSAKSSMVNTRLR